MLRGVAFIVAAAVGYVLLRAAWIFLEWPGVAGVVLLVAALVAWSRRRWHVAAGIGAGAALSAVALTL